MTETRIEHPDMKGFTPPRRQRMALEIAPKNQQDIRRLANWWTVVSGGNPAKDIHMVAEFCMKIQKGLELGIAAAQALTDVYIIRTKKQGPKFVISAAAQRALVQASGLLVEWDLDQDDDGKSVSLVVQRIGMKPRSYRLHVSDYAHRIRDAKAHEPWVRHPIAMLKARISTLAVKELFSDVLMGVISHDEAEEIGVDDESQTTGASVVERSVEDEITVEALEAARDEGSIKAVQSAASPDEGARGEGGQAVDAGVQEPLLPPKATPNPSASASGKKGIPAGLQAAMAARDAG